jgi:hypothetical protein
MNKLLMQDYFKVKLGEGQCLSPFLLDFPSELLGFGEYGLQGIKVVGFQGRFDFVQTLLEPLKGFEQGAFVGFKYFGPKRWVAACNPGGIAKPARSELRVLGF